MPSGDQAVVGRENIKLTSADSDVTTSDSAGASGVWSDYFTYTVGQSENIVLRDGKALRQELRNTSGNDLPDGDRVRIAWQPPNSTTERAVGDPFEIRRYNTLTLSDQLNQDFASNVRYEVPDGALRLPPDFILKLQVDSSDTVDVSQSNFYAEIEVQREKLA